MPKHFVEPVVAAIRDNVSGLFVHWVTQEHSIIWAPAPSCFRISKTKEILLRVLNTVPKNNLTIIVFGAGLLPCEYDVNGFFGYSEKDVSIPFIGYTNVLDKRWNFVYVFNRILRRAK